MKFNKFPTMLINKSHGNPFDCGFDMNYLHNDNILSFIFCDIYVDETIHRPVFQTHVKINNQVRTVCATGLFKNQMIFLPEMLEYQRLSNNKIRIVDN